MVFVFDFFPTYVHGILVLFSKYKVKYVTVTQLWRRGRCDSATVQLASFIDSVIVKGSILFCIYFIWLFTDTFYFIFVSKK